MLRGKESLHYLNMCDAIVSFSNSDNINLASYFFLFNPFLYLKVRWNIMKTNYCNNQIYTLLKTYESHKYFTDDIRDMQWCSNNSYLIFNS